MGSSFWSDDFYNDRKADRDAKKIDAFDYDAKIKSGAVATKTHDKLNPYGVVRESRDSKEHPESNAIMVLFDVTGSMSGVPRVFQQNLPKLHGLLTRKNYIRDPQVLFGAIGDAYSDKAPLQIGQFESGNEMEDDIGKIYLEGNGGGQSTESYELGMYFALYKTSLDCFEKRKTKGYLFLTGDENAYPEVNRGQIEKLIGGKPESSMSTEQLVNKLKEKFHCYFIIPKGTSNAGASWLDKHWKELFGQNVIKLDDAAGICECIALVIGLNEGTVDLADGLSHIKGTTDAMVVRSVGDALSTLAKSAIGAKSSGSALVDAGGVSGSKRL